MMPLSLPLSPPLSLPLSPSILYSYPTSRLPIFLLPLLSLSNSLRSASYHLTSLHFPYIPCAPFHSTTGEPHPFGGTAGAAVATAAVATAAVATAAVADAGPPVVSAVVTGAVGMEVVGGAVNARCDESPGCGGEEGRGSGSTGEEGSASEERGDGSGSESESEYYDEEMGAMGAPVGVRPVRVRVLVPPLDLASFLFPVSARVTATAPVATPDPGPVRPSHWWVEMMADK
jgi:hypothetical protein